MSTSCSGELISHGPHGFRVGFSYYKSMGANDPGAWPVWTPGLSMQDLCRRPQHCYILNMLALGLMVSEKKIFEGSLAV